MANCILKGGGELELNYRMDNITQDQIKTLRWVVIVSAIMLFLAMPSGLWSYGYYVLLRWVVAGTGVFAAYISYNLGKTPWVVILGLVVLLFNPIVPFHLSKATWVFIDFIAAIFLVATIPVLKLPKRDEPKSLLD